MDLGAAYQSTSISRQWLLCAARWHWELRVWVALTLNSDHASSLLAIFPPSQFSKPSLPVFFLDEKPAQQQEDTCLIMVGELPIPLLCHSSHVFSPFAYPVPTMIATAKSNSWGWGTYLVGYVRTFATHSSVTSPNIILVWVTPHGATQPYHHCNRSSITYTHLIELGSTVTTVPLFQSVLVVVLIVCVSTWFIDV